MSTATAFRWMRPRRKSSFTLSRRFSSRSDGDARPVPSLAPAGNTRTLSSPYSRCSHPEEILPMSRVVSSIVFVLLVAGAAGAQSTANGSIHGVASDQNHDVLPGVAITATSTTVPGRFTATTDRAGQYLLANVPPGDYTIVAELSGFTRLVRTPVTVRAGLNVEADLAMQVGRVEETVEVH